MTAFIQVGVLFRVFLVFFFFFFNFGRVMRALWQEVYSSLRSRWHSMQAVRREEHRIPFDLCN